MKCHSGLKEDTKFIFMSPNWWHHFLTGLAWTSLLQAICLNWHQTGVKWYSPLIWCRKNWHHVPWGHPNIPEIHFYGNENTPNWRIMKCHSGLKEDTKFIFMVMRIHQTGDITFELASCPVGAPLVKHSLLLLVIPTNRWYLLGITELWGHKWCYRYHWIVGSQVVLPLTPLTIDTTSNRCY